MLDLWHACFAFCRTTLTDLSRGLGYNQYSG